MIGSELSIPVITIIVGIITVIYLLIMFDLNIGKARTVRVIKTGEMCRPNIGDLPVIPDKKCDDGDGNLVQCFQPDPSIDLIYQIGVDPVYYRSVCSKICIEVSVNGGCVNETNNFKTCINDLEPPQNCNSSANPLGRLEGTDDIYYATGIITK